MASILTSAVRADPRFRHLPIVLVTSLDTPADRERGIAAGADSYIVKRAFDQRRSRLHDDSRS